LHVAHFNDCCPSSGALALEELSPVIYSLRDKGIACNIYTESDANVKLPSAGNVHIVQQTKYPFEGNIRISLYPEKSAAFPLYVRIPDWARTAIIKINGKPFDGAPVKAGAYYKIERPWKAKDVVDIQFPYQLKIIYKSEIADAPQGGKSMYSVDWFALTAGPLVYAADGLLFGTEREEVIALPDDNPESLFSAVPDSGDQGGAYKLEIPGKKPISFVPYYRAGERKEGAWRLTWLQKRITN
jgi:DUF1680 family protein